MAGYSGTPLVKKIGLKPGHNFALPGAPAGFLRELAPLPDDAVLVKSGRGPLDCVVLFTPNAATLKQQFAPWAKRLTAAGMLWIAWPKQASGIETDVKEGLVRTVGLKAGLVDIKICAVNDVWSGLKFVRRLKDR